MLALHVFANTHDLTVYTVFYYMFFHNNSIIAFFNKKYPSAEVVLGCLDKIWCTTASNKSNN